MKPSFKKEYQEEWTRVEQLVILAMLYHSNSIEETKLFLEKGANSDSVTEKLKLIGSQLNDVISWMQSRLKGEQEFQFMINDIVEICQTEITEVAEAKRKQEEEKKIQRAK